MPSGLVDIAWARSQGRADERTFRRRRVLLLSLVVAALATLVLALTARRPPVWAVQLTVDAVLAVYLGVLIHLRNGAAEQEMARHGLRR